MLYYSILDKLTPWATIHTSVTGRLGLEHIIDAFRFPLVVLGVRTPETSAHEIPLKEVLKDAQMIPINNV